MKTERRHELQTNWLADRMGELLLIIKPYLKALTGVLLVLLVLWCSYMFISHQAAAEEAGGWTKLWRGLDAIVAGNPVATDELQSLADSSPKRPTGEWAQLLLADNDLSAGVSALFTEKAFGRNRIKSALERYQSVLQYATDPLVREQALFGVGRALESQCKLNEAEAAYKQLRDEFPNGAYAARAKDRLEDLARDTTRARYDWFEKLEPPSNVFGKGAPTGEKSLPSLPTELEPFSQFTPSPSKTPPPEPKPDQGPTKTKESTGKESTAKEPKASKPGEAKPAKAGENKTGPTKPGQAKTPAAGAPATSSSAPTPPATSPTAPKTDDKSGGKTPAAPPKPADNKS